MGEWLYNNFAVKRFHTKKLCCRLYSTEIEFYLKNKKLLFEPPFEGLRGNIHTPSIAHWKAHGQLPIRHNWTFFAISYRLNRTFFDSQNYSIMHTSYVVMMLTITAKLYYYYAPKMKCYKSNVNNYEHSSCDATNDGIAIFDGCRKWWKWFSSENIFRNNSV